MKYEFTAHALEKFKDLEKYNFKLSENQVLESIKNPDKVERSRKGRKVAQARISDRYILRVIYEEIGEVVRIITFYPARRERYEN